MAIQKVEMYTTETTIVSDMSLVMVITESLSQDQTMDSYIITNKC